MAKKINHGTVTAYQYHKCRCEICNKANSEYMKPYRAKANALKSKGHLKYTESLKAEPAIRFAVHSKT